MRSLRHLLHHDIYGEDKRWQRFMSNMIHVIAQGKRINDTAETFGAQLDAIYKAPWVHQETGEESVARLLK